MSRGHCFSEDDEFHPAVLSVQFYHDQEMIREVSVFLSPVPGIVRIGGDGIPHMFFLLFNCMRPIHQTTAGRMDFSHSFHLSPRSQSMGLESMACVYLPFVASVRICVRSFVDPDGGAVINAVIIRVVRPSKTPKRESRPSFNSSAVNFVWPCLAMFRIALHVQRRGLLFLSCGGKGTLPPFFDPKPGCRMIIPSSRRRPSAGTARW
mmetsp:Transcript_23192/g.47043  ORF Transcript_23192/g.47043 Transcript_23192/m.47043 type:complete len:207 (-) Transcript_23192:16-636(-)